MVRLTTVLVLLSVLLGALPLAAQTLQLDYVSGTLEVRRGSAWAAARVGDRFAPADTLRVAAQTVAELSSRDVRVVLAREGVFSLSDLIGDSRRLASWKMADLFGAKLKALVSHPGRGGITSGGARAGEMKEAEDGWVDEDRQALQRAKAALEAGDHPRARRVLETALEEAVGPEADEMRFWLGWLQALAGETAQALATLLQLEADPARPYYPDLVLLKGQLLVGSLAYPAALRLCDAYLAQDGRSARAQEVGYLSALAARGMGDAAEAARRFRRAEAIDPTSEVGRAASGQARGL